ncbi:MarR family winged helix-turn-helix transcriptional regulator [Streptomyces rubradiris]|uniref:HTH marR-type domain-containing protein n=1 Tax=Streptomyces rubradiris TaxID=285531 RepID=A0ABQ3RNZ7_STRRR|nr:MarR family transcriptional regulator [Streptomyces rubradiris]GHH12468.1 hypothetical protein GCM10018792_37920 [Streptomyces rubradiris]GHI57581.1 hypothetical protein Srubr_74270 [Streptomyces rubradiris]
MTPGAPGRTAADDELSASAWRELRALCARVEAALAAELLRFGLSVREYRALDHLHTHRGEPVRVRDFADALCLGHSGATRLITRLERRELIARRPSATDRRALEVELTIAGDELFGRVGPAGTAALAGAFAAEGARPADDALARVPRQAAVGPVRPVPAGGRSVSSGPGSGCRR